MTVTASEEYPYIEGWQTGVQSIQLLADGDRSPGSKEYGRLPQPRAGKSWKQTYEATDTVPAEPPPVVRLRALVADFAGNEDSKEAEFPTADWYGTIEAHLQGNVYNDVALTEFAFSVSDDGTLTGRGRVHAKTLPQPGPDCVYTRSIEPSDFDVEIGGRRNGDSFEIEPVRTGSATYVLTYEGSCNGMGSRSGPPCQQPFGAGFHAASVLRVRAQDRAQNEIQNPVEQRQAGWVVQDRIVIHQSQR